MSKVLSSVEEAIATLRPLLRDYLEGLNLLKPGAKSFRCFVHDDHSPSMGFVQASDSTVVHCFSCQWSGDIFSAASVLESLPADGPDWVRETVPFVAEAMGYELAVGEPTPQQLEKLRLQKLLQDIQDLVFQDRYQNTEYMESRNWLNSYELGITVPEEQVRQLLAAKGWNQDYVSQSGVLGSGNSSVFGTTKVTFAIKNQYGRPVTFIARALDSSKPKYIRGPSNQLFDNQQLLMGMDLAIKPARDEGLYIVEGQSDRLQFLRLGHLNVVAVNSASLSSQQLLSIRAAGIKDVFLCLDWDEPGVAATKKILTKTLKEANAGLQFHVCTAPKDQQDDPDAWLREFKEGQHPLMKLDKLPAFVWLLGQMKDVPSERVCEEMIPVIAAETTASRREMLAKALADRTGITVQSIMYDVQYIAEKKGDERKARIAAEVEKYRRQVEQDVDNLPTLLGTHTDALEMLEKQYSKAITGVGAQLQRFEEIQDYKAKILDVNQGAFQMKHFKSIQNALAGGTRWTSSVLVYVPGKPNSGKTALLLNMATDVLFNDDDAIVVLQTIDDSYEQIEPRLVTALAQQLYDRPLISIGEASSPYAMIQDQDTLGKYHETRRVFRDFIGQEKLVVLDQQDGTTMAPLERTLRYLRNKYPSKKILVSQDNTHNLQDFPAMDKTNRIEKIADYQKLLAAKYHCAMFATAEYRKPQNSGGQDMSKVRLPSNDDIADSRALYYRANAIIHVYNDFNDRADYAQIFWTKPGDNTRLPTLNAIFGKNKISAFKSGLNDSLAFNLDPLSVTMIPVDRDKYRNSIIKNLAGGSTVQVETDYEE